MFFKILNHRTIESYIIVIVSTSWDSFRLYFASRFKSWDFVMLFDARGTVAIIASK